MPTVSLGQRPSITTTQRSTSSQQKPSILVLEDDGFLVSYYKMILENNSQLLMAKNLTEARHHIANAKHIDIAYLDLHLPDGYGYQIIDQLKASHPNSQVVAVCYEQEPWTVASDRYVIDFMNKPFTHEQLIDNVSRRSRQR